MRSSWKGTDPSEGPQLLWGHEVPTGSGGHTSPGPRAVHQGQGVQVVEHNAEVGGQQVLGQGLGQVAGSHMTKRARGLTVQKEVEMAHVAQGQLQPVLPCIQAAVLGEFNVASRLPREPNGWFPVRRWCRHPHSSPPA